MRKPIAVVFLFLILGMLVFQTAYSRDEYRCPDGALDCVTVVTPSGTKVYHKGN